MAKYCANCGNEIKEGAKFCANCGASINDGVKVSENYPLVIKRDIVTCIIFSILTCGIYGIYWFITMTNDSNSLVEEKTASGATAFLYSLITCGIYGIYWNYKMGKKMHEAGLKYGKNIDDNSILYLFLSIIALGIVSNCLIQSDLNKFSQ